MPSTYSKTGVRLVKCIKIMWGRGKKHSLLSEFAMQTKSQDPLQTTV